MQIIVEVKNIYGVERIYAVCNNSKLITKLKQSKTLNKEDISILRELGYTIETKQPTIQKEKTMLTKKHFKEIAEIVLNNTDKFKSIALKSDFINDLSNYFIEVNPNFNRDKFIDACHNQQSKWKKSLETEIEKRGFDTSKIEIVHIR